MGVRTRSPRSCRTWRRNSRPTSPARSSRSTAASCPRVRSVPERGEEERMTGNVAIITGAAGGIGEATAAALGRRGCRLVLADLNIDGAHAVAKRLQDQGFDASPAKVDVG